MKHSIGAVAMRRLAPVALIVALVAASCSSSGDGESSGTTPTDVEQGARSPVTLAADGTPTPGGTLTYGIEAETTGFKPTADRWSIVGTMMGLAVYDPLVALDAEGAPSPYLAESFEPNDDYTQWTFTLRDGVTFHDGTALTAEAVAKVFELHIASPLTGAAVSDLESVEATGPLTVVFTTAVPWAAFPSALTGQIGVIPSPDTLDREDGGQNPVGTGPFEFVSWEPDKQFEATRYDDYWRTDTDGNALPYLDGVVFQPTPENPSRLSGLRAGDFDMIHTTDQTTIVELRDMADSGEIQLVEDQGEAEEYFVMLNTSAPPFDDIRARQALAYATDAIGFNSVLNYDVNAIATGPFTPDSPWYLADNGYPEYDPTKAAELVEEIKAEKGEFSFNLQGGGVDTRPDLEYLLELYTAVGMDVTIDSPQQNTFITDAVGGNYQANVWRQFGSPDPDYDSVWWNSANAEGPLALNIARNQDPRIDEALATGRSSTDQSERKAAYENLQRYFAEDLPYIWLYHTIWAIGATNEVRGITNGPLPDGSPAYPVGGVGGFPGVTFLTQTWLTQ